MEDESKAVAAMRATPASSTLALYVDRWAARIIRELSPLEPVTHEEREWLVARAVAAAHRELVFGLVERAEERVMHLRAQDAA